MKNLEQEIEDLENLEQYAIRKASMLANLLDESMRQQERFIALRTEMGTTGAELHRTVAVPSWVATHSLGWVGKNLKMGSEMPFMESYIDEHGRIRVDERNAQELKQRAPDWTRQPELAAYLLHDRQRKFSTILAVVCPPWVDTPDHPNWGVDGRATENAIKVQPLDTEGRVCLVDLKDTHIYALDGQHRVMGIRGVMDVQERGRLELKKRDGTSTNKTYSREDLLDRFRVDIGELQAVLNETISVEYIPSVIAGETRDEANRRVRDVFVCINSYAKKTKVGESILLDESNGFSIVARNIATGHSLLKPGNRQRVNWENNSIPKSAEYFTTLDGIRTIAQKYLTMIDSAKYKKWEPLFKDQVPLRPTNDELRDAFADLSRLFDLFESLPVFQNLLRGDDVVKWREFPTPEQPERVGHLALRPIGQQVLALAISTVIDKGDLTWDEVRTKLEKLDIDGGFRLHEVANVWYQILYEPRKGTIIARDGNRELATDILIYLLKGAEESERRNLLDRVIEMRTDETGNKWMDFTGEWTETSNNQARLPLPIS